MQKHVKINFFKIKIIIIPSPRKNSRGTDSIKCPKNTFFEIYGQRVETFLRETLFRSQKKEFLELSNYTKHNTLAILNCFKKNSLLGLTCKAPIEERHFQNGRGHWSATLLKIYMYKCSKICFLYTIIKIFIAIAVLHFFIVMVVWNKKREEIFIKLRNENKSARWWIFCNCWTSCLTKLGAMPVVLIPCWA